MSATLQNYILPTHTVSLQGLGVWLLLLPGDQLHDPHVHSGRGLPDGGYSRGEVHDNRQAKVAPPLKEDDVRDVGPDLGDVNSCGDPQPGVLHHRPLQLQHQ